MKNANFCFVAALAAAIVLALQGHTTMAAWCIVLAFCVPSSRKATTTISKSYGIGSKEKTITATAPTGEECIEIMEKLDPSYYSMRVTSNKSPADVRAEDYADLTNEGLREGRHR